MLAQGQFASAEKKNSKIECEKDVYIQLRGEKFNKENYFKWSKTRKKRKKAKYKI